MRVIKPHSKDPCIYIYCPEKHFPIKKSGFWAFFEIYVDISGYKAKKSSA